LLPAGSMGRKPGICYAVTDEGLELPVIDVTHPHFAVSVGPAELRALTEEFLRQPLPFSGLPRPIRKLLMRLVLRGSTLGRAVHGADGSFLSGLNTYLLKLGPDNLEALGSNPIDRRIAASLPVLSVRLRLEDISHLLADTLAPVLQAEPGRTLYLLNIGGGPSADSLNALILLQRLHPQSLEARRIVIWILDPDSRGAAFGARALSALLKADAPLAGLDVSLRHDPYDWSRVDGLAEPLEEIARQEAFAAASSEGGLFEYGSDKDIVNNLLALREVMFVVGSVTRNDAPFRHVQAVSNAALVPRGLERFRSLAAEADFTVERVIERPFSDQVLLRSRQARL
jgi:hypothetical protein